MTLIRLMNALITEFQKAKCFTKNTGMLAWACRNIVELNIFIRYVLLSKSNLQTFLSDRLIDGIDILNPSKLAGVLRTWGTNFRNRPNAELGKNAER
jgi:hypothetical protein